MKDFKQRSKSSNKNIVDFKISIPSPCHEDWNKMNPNSNGRYCNSCEKTVVDFTNKNSNEIKSILENTPGHVCGRFNTKDVYQPLIPETAEWQIKNSWFKTKWIALSAIISLIGFSKKANAQMVGQAIAEYMPPTVADSTKEVYKKTSTVIHGWIKCLDEKKGIAQIEIRVYSGGKEIAYSKNFANGSYFITIPENTIFDFKVDIEYNAVNYQTQIIRELPILKDRIKCDVKLAEVVPEPNWTVMGGIGGTYESGTIIETPILTETIVGQIDRYEEPLLEEKEMYKESEDTSFRNENTDAVETVSVDKSFNVIAYPNPSKGLFNFKIENSEKSEIFIFDVTGKLVSSRKSTSTNEQIDLTKEPNGTYVVRVVSISLNKVKQLKVIKIG